MIENDDCSYFCFIKRKYRASHVPRFNIYRLFRYCESGNEKAGDYFSNLHKSKMINTEIPFAKKIEKFLTEKADYGATFDDCLKLMEPRSKEWTLNILTGMHNRKEIYLTGGRYYMKAKPKTKTPEEMESKIRQARKRRRETYTRFTTFLRVLKREMPDSAKDLEQCIKTLEAVEAVDSVADWQRK